MMKKVIKRTFIGFCVIIFILCILFALKGYCLYKTATSQMDVAEKVQSIRDGAQYISLDMVSKDFLNCIVSVEDHRFYSHNGIDYISIGRALINNVEAGRIVMGGSTITQQLAKNMFFTSEQSVERKIAELFVVNELEKNYSKNEILELYVNCIYYGDGYYGVRDASMGYFHKSPDKLSLQESALLAGLPQAPEDYSLTKNYSKAVARSRIVLSAVEKYGDEGKRDYSQLVSRLR